MSNRLLAVLLLLLSMAFLGAPARADQFLDLNEAVTLALEARDPRVVRFEKKAAALSERAIADSQLPDPKLKLGLANVPVETVKLNREPMTQIQLGLHQSFPRGRTLAFTRKKWEAEASAENARARLEENAIAKDTRQAWLELYYWTQAQYKVADNRQAMAELVEASTASFATGRQSSQVILRTELELSILDDRLFDISRRQKTAKADLARLIGQLAAERPLAKSFPVLTHPPAQNILHEGLLHHPALAVEDARIKARARDIDIAEQQYKPGWSVDVGYGIREGDREDFASIGVSLDLPLFTGQRQDRSVAAARNGREAARLNRDMALLDLRKILERTYADWDYFGKRISLYESVVIKRAGGTAEAARTAYQSGVSDFAELVRARLAELDTDLTLLRLKVNRAQAQAQLLYLAGDAL